jgi:aminocarboxymuconate-semialdehyde decarboxylase
MRAIDIHAHLTPQCFQREVLAGRTWHGMTSAEGELFNPMNAWTPEERLADMKSLGVDVQVVSTNVAFYKYDQDVATTTAIARACNDEVHQMTVDFPDRFAGLATLPMQDIKAAISELERGVMQLGLKGAMINDHVNGRTFDEPEFRPLWKAAEQMGAVIFIHQARAALVRQRINRYHLANTIGNLVERAVTFASFVFGGVMDQCPELKVCLAHGGGYTCFGIGRIDRGWQVRSEARVNIDKPPALISRFYYDCIVYDESALRYLIDAVGIDRVVFGTDWPYDMALDWPVAWVLGEEFDSGRKRKNPLEKLGKLLGL